MSLVWTFGGTALTTYGKILNIDGYLDMPETRGDNLLVPLQDGKVHNNKFYDEREITFYMSITAASATALETALDALRAKIAPMAQQVLQVTREDASVQTVNAHVDKRLNLKRKTNTLAFYELTFTLAYPFFRGNTLYEVTSDAIDGTPTPQTLVVENTGSAQERNPTLVLTGSLLNPVITNTTNGLILTYTGTITSPDTVTIKAVNGEYQATHSVSGSVIGNVTHSGDSALMAFEVGNNNVEIADDTYAGSGSLYVAFYPPYA